MVEISFFPLDIDYITQENKAVIRIFGKSSDGKKVCVLDRNFDPYFWAILDKKVDVEKLADKIKNIREDKHFVKDVEINDKKYLSKDVKSLKIIVNHPSDVNVIRDIIKNYKEVIGCVETDIPFVRRYLMDNNITPLILCSVEGETIKEDVDVDFCVDIEKISSNAESFKNPRILSFDIETYTTGERWSIDSKDPIISLAFYGDNFKKVVTWKKFPDEDVTFVASEAELIQEFNETIKQYKPDYLVGYFTDGFDFPYLKARADKHNIKLNVGLDKSNVKFSRRPAKTAKINGIVHIDIYKFIRNIMGGSLQLDSYDLDTVAQELIGEEKTKLDFRKIALAWDSAQGLKEICEYNLQDAELVYKIFNKVLLNLEELVKLIGQPIFDVCRMSYGQLVEWHLIKRSQDFDELCPNRPKHAEIASRRMHTYKGAFVFEPKPGLYDNLVVLDFRSLYPSIIIAKNVCVGTLTKGKQKCYLTPNIEDEFGKNVRYCFSYKEEGFIPAVVKDLIIRRNRIKEIIDKEEEPDPALKARSYVLKIVANATYGMFGFFGARWYSRECAASITAFGRKYIQDMIKKAEKEKFNVIYSDTDSIVIALSNREKKEALSFLKEVNRELPSLMELEVEDFYPKGVFVMKKAETLGAKKKYALVNEDNILKVRGFETVRRDWSYLAKEVQLKVLEIILKENSVEKALMYVKNILNDIRNKKIPLEEMVIRTQLKKDIRSYDQIGPHVKVAREMMEKGFHVGVGSIIKYVVTEGKGLIRDRAKILEECEEDEYDSEYYINNQILPAVEMIFEATGHKKEELLQDDQKKLGHF